MKPHDSTDCPCAGCLAWWRAWRMQHIEAARERQKRREGR